MTLPWLWTPKPSRIYPDSKLYRDCIADPVWSAELKKRGDRCLAYIENDVNLFTRQGRHVVGDVRGIVDNLRPLCRGRLVPRQEGEGLEFEVGDEVTGGTIIDGEVITNGQYGPEFWMFDLLYIDGERVLEYPLHKRRDALADITFKAVGAHTLEVAKKCGYVANISRSTRSRGIERFGEALEAEAIEAGVMEEPFVREWLPTPLRIVPWTTDEKEKGKLWDLAIKLGGEGIVFKRTDRPYRPMKGPTGNEILEWLKVKRDDIAGG